MIEGLTKALAEHFTARNLALWLIAAVILSVTGPFGTYEHYDFHIRLPYWFLVVAVSTTLAHVAYRSAAALLGEERRTIVDLLATAFLACLFTPVLYLLTCAFLVDPSEPAPSFAMFFYYVVPLGFLIFTMRRFVPGMTEFGYGVTQPQSCLPRLVRRLPETPDTPILRLSSDDHQIDVVTETGRYRIRMRFVDAIDEMDGVEGYCTHRSHWVARAAIRDWEKQNGKVVLRLINEDVVPVSRKYKPLLQEAGIL